MTQPENPEADEVPFEDVVAALLKVDPTGIVGQKAKPRDERAPKKPTK